MTQHEDQAPSLVRLLSNQPAWEHLRRVVEEKPPQEIRPLIDEEEKKVPEEHLDAVMNFKTRRVMSVRLGMSDLQGNERDAGVLDLRRSWWPRLDDPAYEALHGAICEGVVLARRKRVALRNMLVVLSLVWLAALFGAIYGWLQFDVGGWVVLPCWVPGMPILYGIYDRYTVVSERTQKLIDFLENVIASREHLCLNLPSRL